jgi:hypothetical protein
VLIAWILIGIMLINVTQVCPTGTRAANIPLATVVYLSSPSSL